MMNNASFHPFSLLATPMVLQGYFERSYGNMAFDRETTEPSLQVVRDSLGISPDQLKLMKQCHGNTALYVTKESPTFAKDVDGLVTDVKGIVLGVSTADCLPLLFYDPVHEVIAVCHAGYKGLLAGVIQNTLKKMLERGADVAKILVGIGPSICKSCYNVQEERVHQFAKEYPEMDGFYEKKGAEYFLDLSYIADYILESSGIALKNSEHSPFCTKEDNNLFFSRRVEKEGVFLSVLGML